MTDPAIQHISDTARWAAVYRARETERKNPLFRDPFARQLAGERGEQIANATPFHEKHSWSWVTRTYLFDSIIRKQVAQGADMVVNLAAGLDTRPYRMELPSSLKWVEVDVPEILAYKEELLKEEKPACTLRRLRADLSNAEVRRSLLARLAGETTKALVINGRTFGLPAGTGGLSPRRGLEKFSCVQAVGARHRIAGTPAHVAKDTHQQFAAEVPPLQFAPEDGPTFFTRHGWKALEVHSVLKAAAGLERLSFFMRLMALLPENPDNSGSRPWGGTCLLGRE